MRNRLTQAPKLISEKMNKGISHSLGINVPLYYITMGYYVSALHYQDSLIDCIHLIRSGERNAEKMFLVIHENDTEKCIAEMVKVINILRNKVCTGNAVWGAPKCIVPVQHLRYIVTPTWLDSLQIKYTLVRVFHGDMLYIGTNVLYEELSIGFSITESVDIGGNDWVKISKAFNKCVCTIGVTGSIASNIEHVPSVSLISNVTGVCKIDGCSFQTTDKGLYQNHAKGHKGDAQKNGILCMMCGRFFKNKNCLRSHKTRLHRNGAQLVGVKKRCECGAEILEQNMARHRRRHCTARLYPA